MKPTIGRRHRRRTSSSRETDARKKETSAEQSFFGRPAKETFFQPSTAVQRKCEKCADEDKKAQRAPDDKEEKVMAMEEKKEEETVQKKETSASPAAARNTSGYISSLGGKGAPLARQQQQFFGGKMGYDFSNVRIHTDREAADSAKAIRAKAYTTGDHIVFNDGQFSDESAEGKKLLAHELTHVMQQNGQQVKRLQMKPQDDEAKPATDSHEAAAESKAAENEELAAEPIHVSDVTTFGKPSTETVFAKTVKFTGKTDADFDGGTGQTKNLKAVKATDCKGCGGNECVTITGTFEITYKVATNVTLPSVPDGLTTCQNKIVKDAIDHKIAPHEQEHVKAYNAYNGKVQLPINYTGCQDGLQQYLQDLNDADGNARKASAKAASNALDPYFVDVDLDCEEPAVPKK